MWFVRMSVGVLYLMGFVAGVPLLMVGSGWLIQHWLGTAWWTGLLIAALMLAEFGAAMWFVQWERNPLPDFITG